MTKYAGLDWSMSSPGLVIGNSDQPEDLLYFGIRQKKKQVSLADNLLLLEKNKIYSLDAQRYSDLALQFIAILKEHSVDKVFMEGYAYGASGNTFNIGECTGILKYHLWKEGIELEILQPGEIKKFATGKGNANKTLMYECYVNKTGHRIDALMDDEKNGDKIPSPTNDIIDAYYVLQTGINKTRSGTLPTLRHL